MGMPYYKPINCSLDSSSEIPNMARCMTKTEAEKQCSQYYDPDGVNKNKSLDKSVCAGIWRRNKKCTDSEWVVPEEYANNSTSSVEVAGRYCTPECTALNSYQFKELGDHKVVYDDACAKGGLSCNVENHTMCRFCTWRNFEKHGSPRCPPCAMKEDTYIFHFNWKFEPVDCKKPSSDKLMDDRTEAEAIQAVFSFRSDHVMQEGYQANTPDGNYKYQDAAKTCGNDPTCK